MDDMARTGPKRTAKKPGQPEADRRTNRREADMLLEQVFRELERLGRRVDKLERKVFGE